MGWGVFTYIFGGICILGPLALVYWYWKAARQKFREFNAAASEGGDTPSQSGPEGVS